MAGCWLAQELTSRWPARLVYLPLSLASLPRPSVLPTLPTELGGRRGSALTAVEVEVPGATWDSLAVSGHRSCPGAWPAWGLPAELGGGGSAAPPEAGRPHCWGGAVGPGSFAHCQALTSSWQGRTHP